MRINPWLWLAGAALFIALSYAWMSGVGAAIGENWWNDAMQSHPACEPALCS
ncbi:hypothetical protein [Sinorhizobium americanum]|uniref:Uncharacterized protein n=1 Tax=Sinorhizobium americanum TaxID=194963 RepID=A0A4R2BRI9_9HYPH|nr:hypothetical protein [Sinorhizobium americanum]TCN30357.1 hypothetical protein EV184_108231 [Sinorhizobium americanum]